MKVAALALLLAAACGEGIEAVPFDAGPPDLADGSTPPDLAFPTAMHPALPQVPKGSGKVLAAPILVTVTYPGFALETQVKSLGDWIVGSSWLTTVGAEYGVGAGTHVHVQLTDTAPATIDNEDIATLLDARIADHTLPGVAPGVEGSYVYAIFLPPTTTNTDAYSGDTCAKENDLGLIGYHTEIDKLVFTVIGTCASENLEYMQLTFAHELLESATNPFYYSAPAYIFGPTTPFYAVGGGELADLCEGRPLSVDGFVVQQVWSNIAAAAGKEPCIPAGPFPYFDVAPSAPSMSVAAGATGTLQITGWSTDALPAWGVVPYLGGGSSFTPAATLDHDMLANGDTATLSVTVPAGTPSGARANIVVTSTMTTTQTGELNYVYTQWPIQILVP